MNNLNKLKVIVNYNKVLKKIIHSVFICCDIRELNGCFYGILPVEDIIHETIVNMLASHKYFKS